MHHDDGLAVSILSFSPAKQKSLIIPEYSGRLINSQTLYAHIPSPTDVCFAISILVTPDFDYAKANCLRFSIWIDQYEVTRFWIEPKPSKDDRRAGVEYRLDEIVRDIGGHWTKQRLCFSPCPIAELDEEIEEAKFVGKIIVKIERGLMWKGRYQSLRSWDAATDENFSERGVPEYTSKALNLTHCLRTFDKEGNPSVLDEGKSGVASAHKGASSTGRSHGKPYTFHFKYRSQGKNANASPSTHLTFCLLQKFLPKWAS